MNLQAQWQLDGARAVPDSIVIHCPDRGPRITGDSAAGFPLGGRVDSPPQGAEFRSYLSPSMGLMSPNGPTAVDSERPLWFRAAVRDPRVDDVAALIRLRLVASTATVAQMQSLGPQVPIPDPALPYIWGIPQISPLGITRTRIDDFRFHGAIRMDAQHSHPGAAVRPYLVLLRAGGPAATEELTQKHL